MGRTNGATVINTAKKAVHGFEQMYAQLQQKGQPRAKKANLRHNIKFAFS
jgi:hypothetical protein